MVRVVHNGKEYFGTLVNKDERFVMLDEGGGVRRLLSVAGVTAIEEVCCRDCCMQNGRGCP